MSEALNVTKAAFGGLREVTTAPLWQYDYGQILKITGLDLPQAFEVHFSNSRKSGETVTQIGTDSQVVIPDMYLTSGADIYAFVFLHDGLTDGETEYVIKIPVRERPEPSDDEPTPEQQSVIDQAIAALNSAVEQCEAYVEHYPTVIDGYWYVWDEASEQFVSTGVAATGNGIAEARLNQDYTLTLVFTDGSSFTTPISIRGAQGEKGDTGAVPNFTVGTVTTLPAGSAASASITGTQEEPVLNLSIPQGQDGAITNLDTTLTKSGKAADAKATGDAVNDLKEDLNVIENQLDTGIELVSAKWAVGSLWSSSGHYNNSVSNRVATVDMFTVSEAKTYIIDSGWQVGVAVFDSSDTLQSTIAWKTGSLSLATNTLYRLVIARRTEITGETAVISEFVQHIHKVSNIQAQFNALSENDDSIEAELEQINQVIKNGYRVIGSDSFVQGSFNSSGLTSNTTTRIRPNALIPVEVGTKINIIPNGQEYAVGLWTDQMVIYRNDSTFSATESTITISTKGYAIVAVREDSTNPTIVPSDLTLELRIYDVNTINNIESIIDEKLSDVAPGMPDYWKTYIAAKIIDVRNKDVLVGADGDSFMFVTDIHISANNNGKQYNALNSPAVMQYIAKHSGTRWIVNGGDTIELYAGSKTNAITGLQMWQSLIYGLEEYCTPGNHDSNNYDGSNPDHALTYQDFYAIMDRPVERIIDTGGDTYFCMNNNSQKIRYIFVATDLYDNLTNQIAWFKSALTEKDSTWTVLVIQHKLFNDNNTGYHNQAEPFINAINEVYANIQATFIGVLAGHTHIDYSTHESVNGYALISTTCDAWKLQASSQGLTRTPGTYTEQAFDVIHISKTNQIVYMTRIGAGADRAIPFRQT